MEALHAIDERRERIAGATPARIKSELGQFMTPAVIARFMASMFEPLAEKKIRLLDPGAGIGSLTAAFVERAAREGATSLQCEAWEFDPRLHVHLRNTLDACGSLMRKSGAYYADAIQKGDFIGAFSNIFSNDRLYGITHAILNPPYKKINSKSAYRQALRVVGIETSNLYSAFVALALLSLDDGGELVAITPRSFCNGPYFRPFRKFLLDNSALVQIHLFESRTHAFKGDEVLQENIIFHLVKGKRQGKIIISSSGDSTFADVSRRAVAFADVVAPNDKEIIFHLVPKKDDEMMAEGMRRYTSTLDEIGIDVTTGPVVDFRLREHLRKQVEKGCAPLIWALHFKNGFVAHPRENAKKPNGIQVNGETAKWLMPTGHYVIVRRLSSKEEKRRIVPAVFDPSKVPGPKIGFENHLNVFHSKKNGLSPNLARGLAVFLGSTLADRWLRRFNGHTQVNAGDLRALRYPKVEILMKWGATVRDELPSQEIIDAIVEGEITGRALMSKFLPVIAWETEVWCAADPDHLIHFNGEKFLGPYA